MKKCTNFEKQKGIRYIRGNAYFGIIFFSCLSSTKLYLRFLLIWFARNISGFYQSSLGNKVDFRDIMNVSPNLLKIKISNNWDSVFLMLITTTLICFNHSKILVPFCLPRRRPENAFLTVNYRKIVQKNKLYHSKQQWIG